MTLNSYGAPFPLDANFKIRDTLLLNEGNDDLLSYLQRKKSCEENNCLFSSRGAYWPTSSSKYFTWSRGRIFHSRGFPKVEKILPSTEAYPSKFTLEKNKKIISSTTREPNELYLLLEEEGRVWVAKYDLRTYEQIFSLKLEKNSKDILMGGEISCHINGKIYIISSRFLYEIEDDGEKNKQGKRKIISRRFDLFYDANPYQSIYRGLIIGPDGSIFAIGNWVSPALECKDCMGQIPSVVVRFFPGGKGKNERMAVLRLGRYILGELTGTGNFLYAASEKSLLRVKIFPEDSKYSLKKDKWEFSQEKKKIKNLYPFGSSLVGLANKELIFFPKEKGEKKSFSITTKEPRYFLCDKANSTILVVGKDSIDSWSVRGEEEGELLRKWTVPFYHSPSPLSLFGPPEKRQLVYTVERKGRMKVSLIISSIFLVFVLIYLINPKRFKIPFLNASFLTFIFIFVVCGFFSVKEILKKKDREVVWRDVKDGKKVISSTLTSFLIRPIFGGTYIGEASSGIELVRTL